MERTNKYYQHFYFRRLKSEHLISSKLSYWSISFGPLGIQRKTIETGSVTSPKDRLTSHLSKILVSRNQ